jgi:Tol biopolymer transport system component
MVGEPGLYRGVEVSPDGKRIALHRHDAEGGDIRIIEPRGTTTRLTFDSSQDYSGPLWSPDGNQIAFGALRNGKWGLYQESSNGGGAEPLLVESELPKAPMAWSPDNKSIIYWISNATSGWDLWLLPVAGDRKPIPLLSSKFNESHGQISPDGRWIAYHANPMGRYEVFVQPFPSGDGMWQVSKNGGIAPRWRGDGKEIFYINNERLMAVTVSTVDTFQSEAPRELFEVGYKYVGLAHLTNFYPYAVSRDGQRFLIPRPASSVQEPVSAAITIVLNWTTLLKQ